MISTILLAIPGLVLIWMLITYVEHLVSLRRYPKGPFPLPLIGNIMLLSEKPFLDFLELAKTYGDVFSLSLGKFSRGLSLFQTFFSNSIPFDLEAFLSYHVETSLKEDSLCTKFKQNGCTQTSIIFRNAKSRYRQLI